MLTESHPYTHKGITVIHTHMLKYSHVCACNVSACVNAHRAHMGIIMHVGVHMEIHKYKRVHT